mmetsp:Transcript_13429/g.25216  ORF Transcript_13429/g.25216 Transcript_13429/m.25216 type:complete len:487 (+) Transcript_13429:1058-2518(+)
MCYKCFFGNSLFIKVVLCFLVPLATTATTMFHNSRDGSSVDKRKVGAVVAACLAPLIRLYQVENQWMGISNSGGSNYKGRPKGSKTVKRERRSVERLFRELTDHQFRRMYRMSRESFWKLLDIIEPNMPKVRKRKRGKTPNGSISHANRLAMALRYFCGGDPQDIGLAHGVNGTTEVLKSVWFVVDAVNLTSSMNIKFPVSHDEQRRIAAGFKAKSRIGLANCVGAIDGLLIWIHKPTKVDVKDNIGFGESKFFCGRKKKYGLNLMGTCDARGFFLDVEIRYPGSSSDFYAFLNSNLREKLERNGFLAEGLCLYGDNAYVNTPYMAVPFKCVRDGAKDAFNFFHSSLRINIECAFGMLVHRWGLLRKAIPMNITVKKTGSLVMCLCKLHNFCISQSDNVTQPLAGDVVHIANEGGFAFPIFDGSAEWEYDPHEDRLDGLMDGGEHFDDANRRDRRRYDARDDLPHMAMLKYIEIAGYQRPNVPNNI